MIYVMINDMVFRVSDSQLNAPDSWRYILRKHISYFADQDGLNGLLQHIGEENAFYERLVSLANSFTPGDLRQPFHTWDYVEPDLKGSRGQNDQSRPNKTDYCRRGASAPLVHPILLIASNGRYEQLKTTIA